MGAAIFGARIATRDKLMENSPRMSRPTGRAAYVEKVTSSPDVFEIPATSRVTTMREHGGDRVRERVEDERRKMETMERERAESMAHEQVENERRELQSMAHEDERRKIETMEREPVESIAHERVENERRELQSMAHEYERREVESMERERAVAYREKAQSKQHAVEHEDDGMVREIREADVQQQEHEHAGASGREALENKGRELATGKGPSGHLRTMASHFRDWLFRKKDKSHGGSIDHVHFSVSSPATVAAGASFVLNVWAHLEAQREAVRMRAAEATPDERISIQSRGPLAIVRGTVLTVRLQLPEQWVTDPDGTILWEGEIGNTTFQVSVPAGIPDGHKPCLASIYVNGLRIAKLHFSLRVGPRSVPEQDLPLQVERHRKAFVSYASQDRDEVLGRVQGILKVAPTLDVFLDVLKFRSGQNWDQELWKQIPTNDIFYLFWSENAKRSDWVEKEWRCALRTRGLDFIDPVPLVSPELVPPPPELAAKHFNDWTLAFLSRRKTQQVQGSS